MLVEIGGVRPEGAKLVDRNVAVFFEVRVLRDLELAFLLVEINEVIVAEFLDDPLDANGRRDVQVQEARLRHMIDCVVEVGLFNLVSFFGEGAGGDYRVFLEHLLP